MSCGEASNPIAWFEGMGYQTAVSVKRTAETYPHNSLFRSMGHVSRYYQCNLLWRTALVLSIPYRNAGTFQNGMLIDQVTGMKDINNIKKRFLQYNGMIRPARAMTRVSGPLSSKSSPPPFEQISSAVLRSSLSVRRVSGMNGESQHFLAGSDILL